MDFSSHGVQCTCFILASEYLSHMDPLDLSVHVDALLKIHVESEFCDEVKRAYHRCRWCSQDIAVQDCSWPNCFTLSPLAVINSSIDIASSCNDLTNVFEQGEIPSSIDLCYKLSQVSHVCPGICGNYRYDPWMSCFNAENPPLCFPSSDNTSVYNKLEAQEICNTINSNYLNNHGATFDLPAHVHFLSKIPAGTEFCAQVKQVYHDCIWCAPNATTTMDNICSPQQLSCSAPPPILRANNVNYNATCQELDDLYTQYSQLLTIELCDDLNRNGTLCTNICTYNPKLVLAKPAESSSPQRRCFESQNLSPALLAEMMNTLVWMRTFNKCASFWNRNCSTIEMRCHAKDFLQRYRMAPNFAMPPNKPITFVIGVR